MSETFLQELPGDQPADFPAYLQGVSGNQPAVLPSQGVAGDEPAVFPASLQGVAGNADLLSEILLWLPPKSLLRFQAVCKDWFSIISSRTFRQLHCRRKLTSGKVDGLFFCWWVYGNNYVDFIPLHGIPKNQKVWRNCVDTEMKILDANQHFLGQGVFLNGCMHWVSEMSSFLRFDLDSMCFRDMPSTDLPIGVLKRSIRYFGESVGHLHLIEIHGFRSMSFEVLEMEIDYSKWFVKYRVDLSSLHTTNPLMLSEELDLLDVNGGTCNVVSVVVDDKEDTTRLLVTTPDVIIEYDAHRRTIKEVADIEIAKIPVIWEDVSVFEWYDTHQYVETMACV
ncbi:uncharacterized protein LOC107024080 isoform X2 [Solanum pennellii]|uniref:Uncharacterized protein LOC107024080 isoform X2 n=1 Tax=Solanum pennellii TaxID=28526 RepID=A0ABM1VFJ1_SOLPN|nr:uncharacterized protein LOC107024080 isoform X2 [Solanum pennellii]